MATYVPYNCSFLRDHWQPPQTKLDVTGISAGHDYGLIWEGIMLLSLTACSSTWCFKVVIGLIATVYLNLFLVIIQYLGAGTQGSLLNPVDHGIVTVIRIRLRFKPFKAWVPALQRRVLIFSDQQLVMGSGVLAAGFSELRRGISMYYWQIIREPCIVLINHPPYYIYHTTLLSEAFYSTMVDGYSNASFSYNADCSSTSNKQ